MNIVFIHTHPVQYQVPIYRLLNSREDVKVTALFFSDHSVKGGNDRGFGQAVKGDVPMLEGYDHRFLKNEGAGNEGTGFSSYQFLGFRKVLEELKPDAVVLPGYGFKIYWQAAKAAHGLGIHVAVRPECVDGAQPKRPVWKSLLRHWVYRWGFFRQVDVFCATGHYSRLEANRFGFKDSEITDSLYSVDTELIEKRWSEGIDEREDIRRELGMAENDLGVVFMAKFIDWKNPSLILQAIETLPDADRKRVFPILVGSGPDFDKVKALAEDICGPGNYSCPGFVNQSELCRYYAAADVAVLPSKRGHESWGLVVNEAMTCGLPVAVSDGVGCRVDLVEGKGTGYVFEDGDAQGLGEIFQKWLQNPDMIKKQGDSAKELIKDYSSFKAVEGILEAGSKKSGKLKAESGKKKNKLG
jgi:glycosyltransferase involved in cell wall biosynthesis